MIDVSNDSTNLSNQVSGNNGMQNMVDNSMGHLMQNHNSNENLLLHNEIM